MEHETEFSISAMCRSMDLPRSSYYEWLWRPESARAKEDKELIEIIRTIFQEGRGVYGTRRIKIKLTQKNIIVSHRKIGRLMRENNMICKTRRKFKATTNSKHNRPVAPNLLNQQFNISKPNTCWVGDISYVPTNEGWLYLATVLDLYSRKIVGWSMASHMRAELVNDALLMAIWQRKPSKGLIWHTDRGSQYASISHREIIAQHSMTQSMSDKGNCYDNAVAESFFHTLKTELTHHHKFKTREEARHEIFEYIEVFYNRIRIHSANDYLSPVEYEDAQYEILTQAV